MFTLIEKNLFTAVFDVSFFSRVLKTYYTKYWIFLRYPSIKTRSTRPLLACNFRSEAGWSIHSLVDRFYRHLTGTIFVFSLKQPGLTYSFTAYTEKVDINPGNSLCSLQSYCIVIKRLVVCFFYPCCKERLPHLLLPVHGTLLGQCSHKVSHKEFWPLPNF